MSTSSYSSAATHTDQTTSTQKQFKNIPKSDGKNASNCRNCELMAAQDEARRRLRASGRHRRQSTANVAPTRRPSAACYSSTVNVTDRVISEHLHRDSRPISTLRQHRRGTRPRQGDDYRRHAHLDGCSCYRGATARINSSIVAAPTADEQPKTRDELQFRLVVA